MKKNVEGSVLVSRMILVCILLILSPFFLPTLIFLSVALIPTVFAYFSESSSTRYKWLCVGSLNIAASLPFLFMLWFNEDTFIGALRLITEIRNIMIIYGTSLVGFLIHLFIPPAIASYVQMSNKKRLAILKGQVNELIIKWGDGVKIANEEIKKKTSK